MKHLPFLLTLALLALSPSLRADEDTPLEGQMKILARGMKQLSKQITDPAKQQENIALLETLQKATVDSKSFEPAKTKTVPEGGRATFLADYGGELDKLKSAIDQVEQAVKAGDYAKAQSLLGKVGSIRKEGHDRFKQD